MTSNTHANGNERSQSLALLERIAAATEANAAAIHALAEELAALRAQLEAQPGPAAGGPTVVPAASFTAARCVDFQAESIVVTIAEDGNPAYKVKGFPFIKFGVRVWPEVLPNIGVNPDALKPGTNAFSAMVRAVLNEEGKPKKVIGWRGVKAMLGRGSLLLCWLPPGAWILTYPVIPPGCETSSASHTAVS